MGTTFSVLIDTAFQRLDRLVDVISVIANEIQLDVRPSESVESVPLIKSLPLS